MCAVIFAVIGARQDLKSNKSVSGAYTPPSRLQTSPSSFLSIFPLRKHGQSDSQRKGHRRVQRDRPGREQLLLPSKLCRKVLLLRFKDQVRSPPPSHPVPYLTFSPFGNTVLFVHGKGLPSLIPPPSDKLTTDISQSEPPPTTTPISTARRFKTSPGTIPNPRKRQNTSRTTWRSTR